jgi:photosystem II stability/assembly factor-like uncharacterized protein
MSGTISVLVGTTKGLFRLDADERRADWTLNGPFCDGWPINHAVGDPETGTVWAGGGGDFPGAGVWRSKDGGTTWDLSLLANGAFDEMLRNDPEIAAYVGREAAPPAPHTGEVSAIWSVGISHGRLYAGGKPAILFESLDGGETWTKLDALTDHPSRESWQAGAAGLVLHSIVGDPGRSGKLWVGISAAGVFATEDGGRTWERRNRRSNEGSGPPPDPAPGHDHGHEVGLCVHNFVRADGADGGADLLYQQNHHGVFRSSDGGRSWQDVTAGLPSSFGFPIAVHPRAPGTVWVLPLNGDTKGRYPPDASAVVWRSRDGGESWTPCRAGLPARDCYFTVLRQAMATDRCDDVGVYFGTNSGSVFASRDEGETWQEIARHLPCVLSVETLQLH